MCVKPASRLSNSARLTLPKAARALFSSFASNNLLCSLSRFQIHSTDILQHDNNNTAVCRFVAANFVLMNLASHTAGLKSPVKFFTLRIYLNIKLFLSTRSVAEITKAEIRR